MHKLLHVLNLFTVQSLCQECYNSFKEQATSCTCTTLQVAAVSIGQLPDANSRLYDSSFADELVTDNKENEDVGVLITTYIVGIRWIRISRQNFIIHPFDVSFNAPLKK